MPWLRSTKIRFGEGCTSHRNTGVFQGHVGPESWWRESAVYRFWLKPSAFLVRLSSRDVERGQARRRRPRPHLRALPHFRRTGHEFKCQYRTRSANSVINAVRRQVRGTRAMRRWRQKITFSRRTRRGERVYSRKCAFHVLLISSATYTECALYLARANDGQTAGPSN
jgi:hypothetical protein